MNRKHGLDAVERTNAALALGLLVVAALSSSPRFTGSLAAGVLISAVNYRALRRAVDRLFAGELPSGRAWTAGYGLRFFFVGAAMLAALYTGADPIGLVIGLSTVVPAVVIAAWRFPPASFPSPEAPPPDDPSWDRWDPWRAREREEPEEDDA